MTYLITVYVSIGNSDGKLNQRDWSSFIRDFRRAMRHHAAQVYGEWFSAPDIEDSVAWAVAPETEFI